jgi:hypothetical protein
LREAIDGDDVIMPWRLAGRHVTAECTLGDRNQKKGGRFNGAAVYQAGAGKEEFLQWAAVT